MRVKTMFYRMLGEVLRKKTYFDGVALAVAGTLFVLTAAEVAFGQMGIGTTSWASSLMQIIKENMVNIMVFVIGIGILIAAGLMIPSALPEFLQAWKSQGLVGIITVAVVFFFIAAIVILVYAIYKEASSGNTGVGV